MAVWNDLYNALPRQGFNPGYGAREFQGLKSRLQDRVIVEHIFGEEESTGIYYGGKHREGSAIVAVEDGLQGAAPRLTFRTDARTSSDIGRVNVDVTERLTAGILETETVDGSSEEALRYKVITVIVDQGSGAEPVEIFNYDKLVNVTFDQTITGIKKFTGYTEVEDIAVSATYTKPLQLTVGFTAPVAPISTKNPMNMGQIRTIVLDAKEHNILDSGDTYNTIETVDGVDYTMETIHVQAVYAKIVHGAVWG